MAETFMESVHRCHGQIVGAVKAIHAPRRFTDNGYGETFQRCVEDQQTWPCATIKAIEDIEKRVLKNDGEG